MPERKKPQHTPPSRLRYLRKMPTISARVREETKRRLKTLRETTGVTLSEIIERGVDHEEPPLMEVGERGFQRGHRTARDQYEVSYPCANCGGTMTVTDKEQKQAIARFLKNAGWRHKQCPQQGAKFARHMIGEVLGDDPNA